MAKNSDTLKPFFKIVLKLFCIWIAIIILGFFILFLISFLPSNKVTNHIKESLDQLNQEGLYPVLFDSNSETNKLDNYTDSLIMNESYYLGHSGNAVLENPIFCSDNGNRITDLSYAVSNNSPANATYSRYWGGFRAPNRLLLTFFNYGEIRWIISMSFFILFALAIITFYKNCGKIIAFLFSISIIVVKPWIICNSMQYSCCFLLTFIFICLLPFTNKNKDKEIFLFFIFGCVTQYFDFYTTPLITFAFPFILLILMSDCSNIIKDLKLLGKCTIVWLVGYLSMWFSKLLLTQLFTDQDAFSIAFSSVSTRIGTSKIPGYEYSYNALTAIKSVIANVFQSKAFFLIILCCFLIFIAYCLFMLKKEPLTLAKKHKINFSASLVFLLIAIMPLIWFAITASPTTIHAFFQYRSITISFFAGSTFFVKLLCPSQIKKI